MTVCIAAICPGLKAIAMVSDTMLSNETESREFGAIKFGPLDNNQRWMCLFSGLPHTYSVVQRKAKNKIAAIQGAPTVDEVKGIMEQTYVDEIEHRIQRDLLRPLHMTRKEFKEKGLAKLGPDLFAKKLQQIEGTHLGVQLIVLGFDAEARSHIFSVDSFGACEEWDIEGFVAIGEGGAAAVGVLNAREHFRFGSRPEVVIWHLLEAKYAAQAARSVGDTTFACVLYDDGRSEVVMSDPLGRLSKLLRERSKRSKAPPVALEIIRDNLDQFADPRDA